MKGIIILGLALLIAGAVVLSYGYFSYTKRETVLEIGPIIATADRTKTVALPPILGWSLVAGGAGLLIFGAMRKNA